MVNIKEPANDQFQAKPDSKSLVEVVIEGMKDKKAIDITVMDVSDLTTLTDFFVICSGTSDTQIKAIADSVEEALRKQTGEKPWKKEGIQARNWIILDFINIVVHVMSREKREYYSIERVWNDARVTHIENE
ncbi:MAG: ribosome silencing factor [Balneolaceae bacterium]|nr:ribosome silencing factor [Balneolaceae bacterium]